MRKNDIIFIHQTKKAFSLIELLIAIAIMAVIMAIAIPNFIGARERARDAKLKGEMNQLKSALRMYYNDYQQYPGAGAGNQTLLGCGASGTDACPSSTCSNYWFAAGGIDGCGTIYMKKSPTFNTGNNGKFYYSLSTDTFLLCVGNLENASDPDAAASREKCSGLGLPFTATSKYYCVCSD